MNIKKVFSIILVFLLAWLGVRWLLPLFSPFLMGALLALAAEPIVSFLRRSLHLPRCVSVGIGVSMTFCILAMVAIALCAFLVRELGHLTQIVPDLDQAAQSGISALRQWLMHLASRTPDSVQPLLQNNVDSLFSDGAGLLNRGLSYLLSLAGNLLSHVPDSALSIGTAILSGYMICAKLPALRLWLRTGPVARWIQPAIRAWEQVKHAIAGWLAAQAKLMSVSFFILTLGLTLLRIPNALLIALGISLVDALPVLGTGAVMIPWALLSALQGNTAQAIGLVGVYIVAALLRSVMEPKLLGRHLGLDPLVTLMALYVGLKLWGFLGMLLAPALAVAVTQLITPATAQ